MATAKPGSSPTALRILLGAQLRHLREAKGLTRAAAGYTIRASESKMSRLELGRVSFKDRDIRDLLMLYGVEDPDEREALLSLAKESNRPAWWQRYSDILPSWFQTYVGLEETATLIRPRAALGSSPRPPGSPGWRGRQGPAPGPWPG